MRYPTHTRLGLQLHKQLNEPQWEYLFWPPIKVTSNALQLQNFWYSSPSRSARSPCGLNDSDSKRIGLQPASKKRSLVLDKMEKSGALGVRVLCWGALMICVFQVASAALPNCSYPGVFAFGDSLTDTGNSIAAFPEKFANAELNPNGILFPTHAADRFTDGKLLVDFLGNCSTYKL